MRDARRRSRSATPTGRHPRRGPSRRSSTKCHRRDTGAGKGVRSGWPWDGMGNRTVTLPLVVGSQISVRAATSAREWRCRAASMGDGERFTVLPPPKALECQLVGSSPCGPSAGGRAWRCRTGAWSCARARRTARVSPDRRATPKATIRPRVREMAAFFFSPSPRPRLMARSVVLIAVACRAVARRLSRCQQSVVEGPRTPSQTASI